MTVAEPPAAPTPQPASPPSFAGSEADAAAQARIDAAFPKGNQPGVTQDALDGQTAAAGAETEIDLFDDEALDGLNFDGLQYRDGVKLRADIVRARDAYKPFRDAFGTMSDENRQALLDAAPELGDDLGTLTSTLATLHPADRAYFAEAMQTLLADPERGAQMLADGAAAIRQAQQTGQLPPAGAAPAPAPVPPGTQPMPEWAQPPGTQPAADPLDQPMTRREYEAERARVAQEQEVTRIQTEILAQARELGYDPDAQVGTPAYDQFNILLALAGQPDVGNDLGKAHERVQGMRQVAIDEFVQAKSADAERPGAPVIPGAPPAEVRSLDTLEDAQAAMQARLAGTLGPDPRARAAGD